MQCPKCKTYNDYESVYCYKCGCRLKAKEKQTHHFQELCLIVFSLFNIGFILVYSIMETLYINPLIMRIHRKRDYVKNLALHIYSVIADFIEDVIKTLTIFKRL